MKLARPSILPMWDKCGAFESAESTGKEDKDAGTLRHRYFEVKLMDPATIAPPELDQEDIEAVNWAVDYVRFKAEACYPLKVETRVNPLHPETWEPMFPNGGRLDAACGPDLFDLKSREREYGPQFAAYALGVFQEYPELKEVRCHALFTATQRARTWVITEDAAAKLVLGILAKAEAAKPTPCDYCGWCARSLICPALQGAAEKVAAGYGDGSVANWHPSTMQTGAEFANALFVWRTCLEKWGKSLEYHALEKAKTGFEIPGFELSTRKGRQYVSDLPAAFGAAGLPQAEFLRCCALRLNSSKTYKDQVGLVEVYKAFTGIDKVAAAKRDVEKKLGELIQRGKDSVTLRQVKGGSDENESES